jgi:hypothetical protein
MRFPGLGYPTDRMSEPPIGSAGLSRSKAMQAAGGINPTPALVGAARQIATQNSPKPPQPVDFASPIKSRSGHHNCAFYWRQ